MKKAVVGALAMCIVVSVVPSVRASHIFSTNITINGTPVAAGNAFTNPTIIVKQGDSVTFSFDLFSYSNSSDTFNVTFSGAGLPGPHSVFFNGSGTLGSPTNYSFNQTFNSVGTFSGTLTPDFPVSFPDYRFPGGIESLDRPSIPFTIQVDAVPEPASLTLFGLMAAGGAFYGWRRRKLAVVA